jgi:hypothetical protein
MKTSKKQEGGYDTGFITECNYFFYSSHSIS